MNDNIPVQGPAPRAARQRRKLPTSELDYNMMVTDPSWRENLGAWFDYFTQDIRLSNYSKFDGELHEVRHFLNLGGDVLRFEMPKSFISCVQRVAAISESSQGKGGWLRRLMNTYHQTFKQEITEPKNKFLSGFGRKKEDD